MKRHHQHLPGSWESVAQPRVGLHVHRLGARTYVLRQALATHFEAPFMYLLIGDDRALLVDTGAGDIPLCDTVAEIVANHGVHELVVTNTHGHGDHVQGNFELSQLPGTVIVGPDRLAMQSYYGIGSWPCEVGDVDLGGRRVEVVPTPGHHADHVCFVDAEAQIALTGDLLYAGRLYIEDSEAFLESVERLLGRCEARDVLWFLGAHIEMSRRPGMEFAEGAREHPNERHLELSTADVREVRDAMAVMVPAPHRRVFDDFVIVPV